MYLHLSKNHIVQISYEIGYILGTLLKNRCIFDLRGVPKARMKYDAEIFHCLDFICLDKIEIVEESTGKIIILSHKMFDIICELNNYTRKELFHSPIFFNSKPCAHGFLDAFKKSLTITFNEKILELIEKLVWYWFEEKISIGTYVNQNGHRMHFFKVL